MVLSLAKRDIAVRYKQTIIGLGWTILQPAFYMLVFSIFMSGMTGVGDRNVPYMLFSFAGLSLWQMFATGVSVASESMVGNAQIIQKVYFPRILLPVSSLLPPAVDFLVAAGFLLLLFLFHGQAPSANIWLAPCFMLLVFLSAMGVGVWLSALNAQYRDVRYASIFLIQLLMFLSPVIYSLGNVDSRFHWLFAINPMAGALEGYRWCLFGTGAFPAMVVVISACSALLLCITSILYFKQMENTFLDVI